MSLIHSLGTFAVRQLPPEMAHTATIKSLSLGLGPRARADKAEDGIVLAGLRLPNRIGLAAGFDKNAQVPDAMLAAGFGFVECGTVTPKPQSGNPKPRLFRLSEDQGVINRMGFNNDGLEVFVNRLRARSGKPGIVGANVGANKDATDRIGDYVEGLRRVWLHCSYVTLNISSPNTPGLRGLQTKSELEALLGRVIEMAAVQTKAHGKRPVFLKVAPDLVEDDVRAISEAVIAHKIDALIVSNTTVDRPVDLASAHRTQTGGLSGRPLFAKSTRLLAEFKGAIGDSLPLIGVGGIASAADAQAKFDAGASAVQLYSALVYQGPQLVQQIKDGLARGY
jgi:dihydroorotate dehydrogenase